MCVKCSEEKPSCAHCLRHLVKCEYPHGLPVRTRVNAASPTSSMNSATTPSRQIASSSDPYPTSYQSHVTFDPSLYTLSDLALLHHWTMVTSPSIVQSPSVNYIWQAAFPQFAFTNGALMSRILSIAGLHRAYLEPSNRHSAMLVADQHHSRAITGLMDSLSHDTELDSDNAIFANAVLTFFYAFISFGPLYNDQDDSTTHASRVLGASWIPLIRGLSPVVERVRKQVAIGPLGSLLDIVKYLELQPDKEDDPEDALINQVRDLWSTDQYSDEDKNTYDESLHALRQCNMWLKQSSQNLRDEDGPRRANYGPWSGPFIWISLIPESFLTLLQQRQIPSMIIFANFGALLHKLNHYWWMEGCGKSIVEVVAHIVGPYWSDRLDWAKQVVHSGSP